MNNHFKKAAVIILILLLLVAMWLVFRERRSEAVKTKNSEELDKSEAETAKKTYSPDDFASDEDYQKYLEKKREIGIIDADEYFESNSDILNIIAASDAKKSYTENEINEEMRKRGFTQFPIIFEYTMEGRFLGSREASEASSEKHPTYQVSFVSKSDVMWSIYVVNDYIMANPISYNFQTGLNVQLILSERDAVCSYDSNTNRFYETIPDNAVLMVAKVEIIDAKTLEKLSASELNKLANAIKSQ